MLPISDFLNKMDPAAKAANEALQSAGGEVFVVGGAVRDLVLNKTPNDYDLLVTDLDVPSVKKALQSISGANIGLVGQAFGIFIVSIDKDTCEVALPRTESSTGAGHKDFAVGVDPNLSIQDDLVRRDFTANSMAINTRTLDLIDPYGGIEDLTRGVLTLVNPIAFKEDPLRILRALTAYSVNGLYPDDATKEQMKFNANKIRNLPEERIQKEMDKLMVGSDPAGAIELAHETGVLPFVLPELAEAMGVDQRSKYHDLDVGTHQIKVLKNISPKTDDPDLRLSALIHDIGKPDSMWIDEYGYGHFYYNPAYPDSADHDELGAQYAKSLLTRLHYPNNRIDRVVSLIKNHMFDPFANLKGARKFLAQCEGDPKLAFDLLNLREADGSGASNPQLNDDPAVSQRQRELLQQVIDEESVVTVKDLAIGGHDLINAGLTPGPKFTEILQSLKEQVVENPELNTKEDLMALVNNMR